MTTMNISLPEEMRAFVEEQLKTGGYSTVSEYIRELIRNAQKQKTQSRLEELLIEGLKSKPISLTPDFWKELREDARKTIEGRKKNTR